MSCLHIQGHQYQSLSDLYKKLLMSDQGQFMAPYPASSVPVVKTWHFFLFYSPSLPTHSGTSYIHMAFHTTAMLMTLNASSPILPRVLMFLHRSVSVFWLTFHHGWQLIIWTWIPARLSCCIYLEMHPHVKIPPENSQITPSDNLGIVNQILFFALTRSGMFLLYIMTIWTFLSTDDTQMLVQSLSFVLAWRYILMETTKHFVTCLG